MVALPLSLTLLRLCLGPIAIVFACTQQPRWWFAPLLVAATLSDIFDGVLARRFGVDDAWLRRFDSITDVIYYCCVFVATYVVAGEMLKRHWLPIALLAASEVTCIAVSYFRFRVYPSVHAYSAKFYGLVLLFTFVAVLAFTASAWPIYLLAVVGLIANTEELIILATSKTPPIDVTIMFSGHVRGRMQRQL